MDDFYNKYKALRVFTLQQTAFLLAGFEHLTYGLSHLKDKSFSDAWLVQLLADARSGVLPSDRTMLEKLLSKERKWGTSVSAEMYEWPALQTTREDLVAWCKNKGIEPGFLFPPQGTTSEPAIAPQKTHVPVEPAKPILFSAKGGRDDQWLARWEILSSENPEEIEGEIASAKKIAAEYNLTLPVKPVTAETVARTGVPVHPV